MGNVAAKASVPGVVLFNTGKGCPLPLPVIIEKTLMKLHRIKSVVLAICGSAAFLAAAHSAIVVGTGNDISYLVIEAAEFGAPLEYEFHYTFDAMAAIDSYTMITAIDAADASLSFDFTNYGTSDAPNYFLNSITYNSVTPSDPDLFWAQWVSGGKSGYPTGVDIASGTWTSGSGVSAPYRTLTPGSWDGFIFNGETDPNPPYDVISAPPSITPVPEPATLVLLAIGGIAVLWRRRARHA